MVEISNLIKERRTVHRYLAQKVDKEILLEGLSLTLWAPNHKLTFPMRYQICSQEKQLEILDLSLKLKPDSDQEKRRGKILNPSLIFLGQARSEDSIRDKEDYATCAMAIQNMHLYYWSKGLGAKWSTGSLTQHEDLYGILGWDSEEIISLGFMWVGYFEAELSVPKRPELDQLLV